MSYQHILVPVDDSPISHAAAEHALNLAKLCKCKVTLLSVVAIDPFVGVDFYKVAPTVTDYFMQAESNARHLLDEIAQSFSKAHIQVDCKITHGVPAAEGILSIADEVCADLIVMGSHGHTGVKKWVLGSVAQNVLAESHIPTLIIKH